MPTDNHPFAFGQYLRDLRLEKDISLEVISARTRIGMSNLLAIEREDHQQLPAVVFVVGYLKAYAQAIGAEPGEAVRRYHASRRAYNDTLRPDTVVRAPGSRSWFRLGGALGLLVILIGLSVWGVNRWQRAARPAAPAVPVAQPAAEEASGRQPPGPPAAPATEPTEPTEPVEAVAESPPAPVEATAAERPKSTLVAKSAAPQALAVLAVEETWLKVITDNQRPVEYLLKPGQKVALEGQSGFNLLIGNATGLKLTFNGRPVKVPGKSGQVVTLQLP
jgi:cytoskeletal protein RodZ